MPRSGLGRDVQLNSTIHTTRDLHFPKAGVDVSQAFGAQPARKIGEEGEYAKTTPVGVNVRGVDPSELRYRGGTRPGLSKWISTRPIGSTRWVLQGLDVVYGAGYDPPGGGEVQGSNSGRVVTVAAVQQGNVYVASPGDTSWTAATNGSSATPPLNFSGIVFSTPLGGKLWYCDGVNYRYYDPETNTVYDWVTTVSGIPIPTDDESREARLIDTWRGRIVLSGILGLPQAIFASRVDVPTDFDVSGGTTTGPVPSQAFAMTVGEQGQVGDAVMSIYAYSDDILFIGTANQIHLVRGDPMAGGTRDLVTDQIGTAWGRPMCRDADGRIWFMSNRGGIYTLVPGETPRLVSWPIQSLLTQVNTGSHGVRLVWDDKSRCVEVFITPLTAASATTHYTFETQTGAWWQRVHGDSGHDPLSVCVLDGNRPSDRAVLLGCWDGYVRKIDHDSDTDDSEPIETEVLLGPLLTREMDNLRLDQLQAVLGADSGNVTCEVLVGNTAEQALDSDPIEVGTLQAGRSLTFPVRRAGHAIFVRLTSAARWSMEQIRVRIAPTGKVARRGR